jgi:hypothetical protein
MFKKRTGGGRDFSSYCRRSMAGMIKSSTFYQFLFKSESIFIQHYNVGNSSI